MIKYQRNNILFRIASSTAIAKFKNDQANSFLQLIRKELYFDNSAKEAVLIEYDRFSQWIFRIERIFLAHGEMLLAESLKNAVIASCMDEIFIIEKVVETNSVIFKPEVLESLKLIHGYAKPILKSQLEEGLTKKSCTIAFEEMLDLLSAYLQHILFAMYELNNNLFAKTKDPFLCVTDFCVHATSNHNKELTPALTRLIYFKSIPELSTVSFEIKNFTKNTSSDLLEEIFSYYGHSIKMELPPEG